MFQKNKVRVMIKWRQNGRGREWMSGGNARDKVVKGYTIIQIRKGRMQ
jgi:hypothetical protein